METESAYALQSYFGTLGLLQALQLRREVSGVLSFRVPCDAVQHSNAFGRGAPVGLQHLTPRDSP